MKIFDLIGKDVRFENETKKTIVSLRVMYIAMLFAFIGDVIIAGADMVVNHWPTLLVLLSLNLILPIHTYHTRTRTALVCFISFSLIWMLMMLPLLGWNAGVQNYFFPMLFLFFFGSYAKNLYKFLVALLALIVRIVLILVYIDMPTGECIGPENCKWLQIFNITAVFACIMYLAYAYSRAGNETERKLVKYNDKLKEEANTDQLTGLFNRRRAKEFLAETIENSGGSPITVSIGDIDFFKKVNDRYGHDAGDEVLKAAATVMRECMREDTLISRWGGEEFLIVLPNCNGDQAYMALERLRRKISDTVIETKEANIQITMTFGISEYDFSGDMEATIKTADERLYRGKENGRNQVVF